MEGQITLDVWNHWNMEIKEKLAETAENFVYIGYRLRQIRDSGMYDGFDNVYDFAANEYGLGRSTVSRFIAINEKFSEGGNSLKLRSEYRGLSQSKLTEMLTLTDEECALITEQTTVSEIRDLKRMDSISPEVIEAETADPEPQEEASAREETQEEGKHDQAPEGAEEPTEAAGETGNTDKTSEEAEERTGVAGETEDTTKAAGVKGKLSPLDKCIVDFFKDKPDMLNQAVVESMQKEEAAIKRLVELLNPSGHRTHKKGIVYLFMYGQEKGIGYKQAGLRDPQYMTWEVFAEKLTELFGFAYERDRWNAWKEAAPAYYPDTLDEEARKAKKEREEVEKAFAAPEKQEVPESAQKEPENEPNCTENDQKEPQNAPEPQKEPCDVAQESEEDADGGTGEGFVDIGRHDSRDKAAGETESDDIAWIRVERCVRLAKKLRWELALEMEQESESWNWKEIKRILEEMVKNADKAIGLAK